MFTPRCNNKYTTLKHTSLFGAFVLVVMHVSQIIEPSPIANVCNYSIIFVFILLGICQYMWPRCVLKLAQAKMEKEPCKAALKLLSCLFTPEELVNGNLSGVTNSKEMSTF